MSINNNITMFLFLSNLFIINVFAQNGIPDTEYFFLRQAEDKVSINKFINNSIEEIKSFDVDSNSIYATDGLDIIAILDTAKNSMGLFSIKKNSWTSTTIPFKIDPISLLVYKSNIFIGGGFEEEILLIYKINNQEWIKPEIPDNITQIGKMIDDFVISDSLLIAIDNIVMPKYLLYYKIGNDNFVEFIGSHELKSNGAYESIYEGRITKQYLALYSNTFSGYIGRSWHISVCNINNSMSSFALSMNQHDSTYFSFSDFALVNDKILIASHDKGLGMFTIKDEFFSKKISGYYPFNKPINHSEISFLSFPNKYVSKITIEPTTGKIILTLLNSEGIYEYKIIDYSDLE